MEKFSGKGLREREPAGSLEEEAPENFATDKFIPVIRPFVIMRYLIGQNQNIPFSKTWRGFSENLGILILALLRGGANPNTKVSIFADGCPPRLKVPTTLGHINALIKSVGP